MANTLSDYTKRRKYAASTLAKQLRTNTVATQIFKVDTSTNYLINNPFVVATTPAMTGLTGDYTVADFTTTDDQLVVNKEVKNAIHVKDFEKRLAEFDLTASMIEDLTAQNAILLDKWALNRACADAGSTYSTAAGGFASANILDIFSTLVASVAGYDEAMEGKLFIVLQNTDLGGIIKAGATNGFTFSDNALYNGRVMNMMGVDIFPVRAGTFVDATVGGDVFTNADNRIFGVKGMATLATPRDVVYEEKGVSGKTGKEIVVYGYAGFKLWSPKASLITRITVTP